MSIVTTNLCSFNLLITFKLDHYLSFKIVLQIKELGSKALFTCTKFYKTHVKYSSLWRHLNYECGKEGAFQCIFCDDKTKQKANLEKHMKRKHSDFNLVVIS